MGARTSSSVASGCLAHCIHTGETPKIEHQLYMSPTLSRANNRTTHFQKHQLHTSSRDVTPVYEITLLPLK